MTTCCDIYRSPWLSFLLGDVRHPGGLALTRLLGNSLGLGPGDVVLDVGCGLGAPAAFIVREFGCRVIALDIAGVSEPARLPSGVQFVVGDSLVLPLASYRFDAVMCECTLSTLVDKTQALAEMARVLRRGGRLGISDIAVSGPLPIEIQGPWAQAACLAGAVDLNGYSMALSAAGFKIIRTGYHRGALLALAEEMSTKLRLVETLGRIGRLEVSVDWDWIHSITRVLLETIRSGTLDYVSLVAEKT